jgi:hypothetical protein
MPNLSCEKEILKVNNVINNITMYFFRIGSVILIEFEAIKLIYFTKIFHVFFNTLFLYSQASLFSFL